MLSRKEYREAQNKAADMIRDAGVVITDQEAKNIEVVDFGLSNLKAEGVQVLTLFSTERIAAKVLVLFPRQTEPEHWHPPVGDDPGKEETVRVIDGIVRFFVPGADNMKHGVIPRGKDNDYTVRHEITMRPGDHITLEPGTRHWFQSDDRGAVMYSFSSCVRDALDQFTDPNIERATQICD